jgi:hypothetical protein
LSASKASVKAVPAKSAPSYKKRPAKAGLFKGI